MEIDLRKPVEKYCIFCKKKWTKDPRTFYCSTICRQAHIIQVEIDKKILEDIEAIHGSNSKTKR